MSVAISLTDHAKIKDLPLQIAAPPVRDPVTDKPYSTFSGGTLAQFGPAFWDYHVDVKADFEWEVKAKLRRFYRLRKFPLFSVPTIHTHTTPFVDYGWKIGDGFNTPDHPFWHDFLTIFTQASNGAITAIIKYIDTEIPVGQPGWDTQHTRTWTTPPMDMRTKFTAFGQRIKEPVEVVPKTEVIVKYYVALNFRSLVEAHAIGEKDPDPPRILEGEGEPKADLGHNGDFFQDTAGSFTYGPKAADAWGEPHPYFVPESFDLRTYKHRVAQARSALLYYTTRRLMFFEGGGLQTFLVPAFQAPPNSSGATFPSIRPDDYRPYAGIFRDSANALPLTGVGLQVADADFTPQQGNPMVLLDPQTVANSPFIQYTTHHDDVEENYPWTDGDGREQVAIFYAAPVGHAYSLDLYSA